MPAAPRRQPDLADVVTLATLLARDEQASETDLLARERRLTPALPPDTDPAATTLAWLDARTESESPLRETRQQVETAWHLTGAALLGLGALLGGSATLAACYFDGPERINVLAVLAVLVGLPALLLVPWILAALPAHLTRRIPGAALLAGLGRAINGGRLARWLWRLFPSSLRESMDVVFGRVGRHQTLYASLQKWAVLRWSQLFALAFQIAALATFLILVVFTDLAFGWNTTLTTGDSARDARRVHRLTTALATPWRTLDPPAVPSLALIEESRYFRAAAEPLTTEQAARLGGWWRFVALAIGVYGLLPRVLTCAVAGVQLRRTLRATLQETPGLPALRRRLHRARLESAAETPDTGGVETSAETPEPPAATTAMPSAADIAAVVNWSEVPLAADTIGRCWPEATVFAAGGGSTVAADADVAARVAAATGEGGADVAVLVLVKGWEPPLMEFVDFVTAVRGALGSRRAAILVLPVGLAEDEGELPRATAEQMRVWQRKLTTVGDPWLRVVTERAEVLP